MVNLQIKWGAKSLAVNDFQVSTGVSGLKQAIENASGVPKDRQKLMAGKLWKGILKDDLDLSSVPFSDGAAITLMGEATTLSKAAATVQFMEDMPVAQQAAMGSFLPAGLVNEGNTCYMNSVLQCIRAVPEVKSALKTVKTSGGGAADVDRSLSDLFSRLDSSKDPLRPGTFLQRLRSHFPKFAETSNMGMFKQHDSEEFHSVLMSCLASELTAPTSEVKELHKLSGAEQRANVIDSLFGIEMDVETTCKESSDEAIVHQKEGHRKLVANIEGGAGKTVQINHLHEGIMHGLVGELEKRSDVLGRNAVWSRTSRVSRLPKYLAVHLIRFFWKKTNNAPGDGPAGVPCKILKPVAFPADNLDLYDMCTKSLQARISANKNAAVNADVGSSSSSMSNAAGASSAAAPLQDDADLAAAIAMSMTDSTSGGAGNAAAGSGSSTSDAGFGPGVPANFTGKYELFGVVTHKGRDSSSGHYIAWVRKSHGGKEWLLFDDDSVTETDTETVTTRLKGGGDEHMAYMLFYRAV